MALPWDMRLAWIPVVLVSLAVLQHSGSDPPRQAASPPALKQPPPAAVPPAERAAAASELLAARRLVVPVQGVARSRVQDNFADLRGKGRRHNAIDIMAPWGTPVLAADDGKVAKVSRNRAGGLALYQVDTSGRFVYYYAHLAGYADGLREGQAVERGEVIGYVGTTGNAPESAPHLHFAVQLMQREGRWWKGEVVNPYEALTQAGEVTAGK
jgi:murein DD-endopeptidase MepM/ murein hydrolase activator NlpD